MAQSEELEMLLKVQSEQITRLVEINTSQAKKMNEMQSEITQLLSQIAWFKRQMFGRKSEKLAVLDPNQLEFDFEGTGSKEDLATEIEEARNAAVKEIDNRTAKEKHNERRNRKLTENLPVVEVVIEPENIDKDRYVRIGEERTRTLEFEPGKLYVKEIVRPKYGLKSSTDIPNEGEKGVIIAPLPLLPINKGLPGASLLAEILLQKYEYHTPFYRQIQEFSHLGIKISDSTLDGWFKPACELLRPLYDKLKEVVLSTDYVQVDETTLPVISHNIHRAAKEYLWMVRSVMKRLVFFHYDKGSRSQETAKKLLKPFKGYLQSDGYAGYNVFEDNADVCLVGCMAHIRRHFEEALDENKELAEYALKEIQSLYHVEHMADDSQLSYDERATLRQKLSEPILNSFEKWMEKTYHQVLPKSRMGQSIAYGYSIMPRMREYLKDGRLKIDNNLGENAIRPITISRKNFLFCGNHEAAENTAIICSLLGSCKGLGVNPREWLNDVLAKLPYYLQPKSNLNLRKLLPDEWKGDNSNETTTKI